MDLYQLINSTLDVPGAVRHRQWLYPGEHIDLVDRVMTIRVNRTEQGIELEAVVTGRRGQFTMPLQTRGGFIEMGPLKIQPKALQMTPAGEVMGIFLEFIKSPVPDFSASVS